MLGPISSAALLSTWERGFGRSLVERGVLLLRLALPDALPELLVRLSIGERNRVLMALRQVLFGSTVASIDSCPACGERMEIDFSLGGILAAQRPARVEQIVATWGECRWLLRLPTSADLAEVQSQPDLSDRARQLFSRCLVNRDDAPDPESWPAELLDRVAMDLASADPHAATGIDLSCSACSHTWKRRFDIVAYLWSELDRLARRLIAEIHLLARAYGWTEAEVLKLSAWRRQMYLDLIRQ